MDETTQALPASTHRACPICKSDGSDVLHRQHFAVMTGWLGLSGYDVVVCRQCGFAFADQIPEQASLDAYYRDMSKHEYGEQAGHAPEYFSDRFRSIADLIEAHLPSKAARILDVGCAMGGLLGSLKERGYEHLLGLDPSPANREAARRIYGVEVANVSLANLVGHEGGFDLIVSTGVLEHVRDLEEILDCLWKAGSAEGLVYVEVPDATAFTKCRNAPFQEFSIEHINFFSDTSLENLFGVHGFRQVLCEFVPRPLSRQADEPAILAMYKRIAPGDYQLKRDETSRPALAEYVRQSQAADDRVRRVLGGLAQTQQPLVVWGTGTQTMRLLKTSQLGQCRVLAFVDSNPRYHGKSLHGVPVLAPSDLSRHPEPILIGSWVYQREIEHTIRDTLRLPNEIILLYDLQGCTVRGFLGGPCY